jgi:SHS2 domain-containing protein
MSLPRWEHFPHQSDVGVRGLGRSRDEAFEQVALALTAVITDPARIDGNQAVAIECRAVDDDFLLFDFLSSIVFEMDTRRMVFGRFEVRTQEDAEGVALHATACGEPVDVERHRPAVEVKAATWSGLRVRVGEDGVWVAECVLDV